MDTQNTATLLVSKDKILTRTTFLEVKGQELKCNDYLRSISISEVNVAQG